MEQWNETFARFSRTTDRLGKPVDPGILGSVVAINVLGIPTAQSCEGHLDHGLAYPWIDLALPALLKRDQPPEIRALQMKLQDLHLEAERQASPQEQQQKREAKQADLRQRYALHQLLATFYRNRQTSFDRIITFSLRSRIRSQGGDFLELLSPDERVQKLREYQEEMALFTDFLKSRIAPDLLR